MADAGGLATTLQRTFAAPAVRPLLLHAAAGRAGEQPHRRGSAGVRFVQSAGQAQRRGRRSLAAILRRVPGAQLELGAGLLGDSVARARTLERFGERGVDAGRLRLQPERRCSELLAADRNVDIALDPFPFSGCATTCDALSRGVPVIARDGTAFVARQSASLLARWDATSGLPRVRPTTSNVRSLPPPAGSTPFATDAMICASRRDANFATPTRKQATSPPCCVRSGENTAPERQSRVCERNDQCRACLSSRLGAYSRP